MILVYMAHPVAPEAGETIESNLASAKAHLRYLLAAHGDTHNIVAPWITEVELFDDSIPEERELGLARCCDLSARCDEIWLVGPRISAGMFREKQAAEARGATVQDMTGIPVGVPCP